MTEPTFYAAGGDTAGVAIGDLDGNLANDIVVARPSSNSIAILFNDGTGTFGTPQVLAAGTSPVSVAIADFNHDGFNDVAVANSGSNDVSIFLGTGGGAFATLATLTTGTEPRAVVTGEFNGDGIVDLAVANAGSNNVQLFYGTGTGTFGAPVVRNAVGTLVRPIALAVGRLDTDNRDDLIAVGTNSTAVIFYNSASLGTLGFPVGTTPVSVAVGDFSQDPLHGVDAVVANEGSNNLTVQDLYPGRLAGPTDRATIPLPGPPSSIVVGDFNGDHRPDVVVVSRTTSELWLLYNSGYLQFSAPIRYQLSAGAAFIAAGDVNGDGHPDVVASLPTVNGVSVLTGADWPVVSKPYFMVIADTSGSMTTSVTSAPSCAGYPATRNGHLRCALRYLFQSYPDDVEFGLSTYAMQQTSCTSACFTGCVYSAFPQDTGALGCGPRPGDATTRAGAFIRVPVRQDNFWTSPPPADNRAQLNAWVDNSCSTSQELFASGATPLNGALRDMKRYFGGTWSAPDGSVSYSTPLSANDRSCRSLNIILITDGDESCDTQADAVAAAADLYNSGVTVGGRTFKVRTYVIGFAGATVANMNAIASAGGTNVSFIAANETQIAAALGNIVASAVFSANALETCGVGDMSCNGCSGEGWLQPAAATNNGPACAGSDVKIHANTFPGATYSWSGPNGYSASTQSPTISAAPGSASGTYTFTATVASCISVSASTQVVVNAVPDASINAAAQVTGTWSSFASVPDAGVGATYTWSVSGATFTGQGTRSIRFTAGASGSVSLNAAVQTSNGCAASGNRTVTIVSTPSFTDDPLAATITIIKAIHLSEARDAVNMVRSKAGLSVATWVDGASPGLVVKASHIMELRNALTPALTVLMRSATYTDPNLATGTIVKAAHIQEIRDYSK